MKFGDLVDVSEVVSATRSRSSKIDALAGFLTRLSRDESTAAVSFLTGSPLQDRLGVGYATISVVDVAPAGEPSLEILDVDRALDEVSSVSGPGSKTRRSELLGSLFGKATIAEQDFLRGLIVRNLRQGALEGVMTEAVASALSVPVERVRRAAMLEGDLVRVATRALADGASSLAEARLELFTPVQPMLAGTSATAGEALDKLGPAAVDAKLDGARIQVHKHLAEVRVFTRNLNDVTSRMPEIVSAVRELPSRSLILDGEALLIGPEGVPQVFQDSMSRFGADTSFSEEPLTAFYFDMLSLDGRDLIDEPLAKRRETLKQALPPDLIVDSLTTDDPLMADRFFDEMLDRGYEGVVVKDLTQGYEAGRRGSGWLKVKPTHSLDLVILGAEWGSGRRQGWLSNLHLGARASAGEFVMLGKTFKGLTDEMLRWQTERFLEIEEHRHGRTVFLRPEIVYEIALDGVQRSTRYPGGVTLRFARVKGYRDDKGPEDADTLETVQSMLRS